MFPEVPHGLSNRFCEMEVRVYEWIDDPAELYLIENFVSMAGDILVVPPVRVIIPLVFAGRVENWRVHKKRIKRHRKVLHALFPGPVDTVPSITVQKLSNNQSLLLLVSERRYAGGGRCFFAGHGYIPKFLTMRPSVPATGLKPALL